MAYFLYAPRSGDPVIADYHDPAAGLAAVRYGNGSRHLLGGAIFRWPAADPGDGKYSWREPARRLAAGAARSLKGIAWDRNGNIGLAVPVSAAAYALELIRSGIRAHDASTPSVRHDLDAAFLAAGGCFIDGEAVVLGNAESAPPTRREIFITDRGFEKSRLLWISRLVADHEHDGHHDILDEAVAPWRPREHDQHPGQVYWASSGWDPPDDVTEPGDVLQELANHGLLFNDFSAAIRAAEEDDGRLRWEYADGGGYLETWWPQ